MYRYKKRFKEKKKKRLFPYFFFSFLILIVVGIIFYFLLFSSFLIIKEIQVENGSDNLYNFINEKSEKNIFGKKIKNFLFFNSKNIKKEVLLSFPEIEDLEMEFNFFPSYIYIRPIFKNSLFVLCNQNSCYNVDKKGVIFSYSDNYDFFVYFQNELSNINLGQKIITEDLVYFINKIKENLETKEIEIINENKINVKTKKEFSIYFDSKKDFNDQLENLNAVVETYILEKIDLIEYIDLRFNDRVYYKFK